MLKKVKNLNAMKAFASKGSLHKKSTLFKSGSLHKTKSIKSNFGNFGESNDNVNPIAKFISNFQSERS